METIHVELQRDYKRWHQVLLDTTSTLDKASLVSTDDVLRAHYLLCDFFLSEGNPIGMPGPRDLSLLASAVGRPSAQFGGMEKWKNRYDKVGTLFFGLVKNHPFHDGNKRTALLVALFHLHKLGLRNSARHRDLEALAIRTASNCLNEYPSYSRDPSDLDAEVRFLGKWFRRNSTQVDKRQYIVTFRRLNGILKRFNFELGDPDGNFIDVLKITERRRGLFRRKIERVATKVHQVSFPGWTREISKSTLASIRKATRLTAQHGCDSAVFFRDAEPLDSLIDQFSGPLKRLRDK